MDGPAQLPADVPRGINKVYLQQYAAIYAWAYRIKRVTIEFLRILLDALTPECT